MPVKLLMTPCGSASDMIAMHGVDKQTFVVFRSYEVSEGEINAFRKDTSGALVGVRLAARYGWKRGDRITVEELGGVSFTVNGIFSTHGTADDFIIVAGRRFVQEATDAQGISNHVLVKPVPGGDVDEIGGAIDALPLTIETTTQPEQAHLAVALDQLADLAQVSKYVIAIIIVVILIAMGNAFSMVTHERSHEFAVLRTLGFSKGGVLFLVLGEAGVLALVGGVGGCVLVQGLIALDLIKTVSSCAFTVSFVAGPIVWLAGIGGVALAGLAGCLAPAWSVSRLNIVQALRRDD